MKAKKVQAEDLRDVHAIAIKVTQITAPVTRHNTDGRYIAVRQYECWRDSEGESWGRVCVLSSGCTRWRGTGSILKIDGAEAGQCGGGQWRHGLIHAWCWIAKLNTVIGQEGAVGATRGASKWARDDGCWLCCLAFIKIRGSAEIAGGGHGRCREDCCQLLVPK